MKSKPNLNLNQQPNLRTTQLSYTKQQRRVLIIFPTNLQIIINAQMLSV